MLGDVLELAAQDDRLPVYDFCCEAWLDDEVAALREHVESNGTSKWACARSACHRLWLAWALGEAAWYYRDNDLVAGADSAVGQGKRGQEGAAPAVPTASRDPPHFVRRRPRPHEVAC